MSIEKQFLLGIGLTIVSKVVIIAPVNAFPDNIGAQIFNAPAFSGSSSRGGSTEGSVITGEGLTGGISIPPGMSLPSTGASSGTSGGSTSGISGDGNTSNASNSVDAGNGSISSGTITIADIANYFTSNIDRSLNELDPDTSTVAQRPRRIVRRKSSASCPNPQISRSSETLDDLLSQSEQFLEQVNQFNPENSAW